MVLIMMSPYDEKAQVYLAPFVCKTEAEGRRMMSDAVNEPGSLVARHPDDFSLYIVGSFNDSSGTLIVPSVPEFICKASEFVDKEGRP